MSDNRVHIIEFSGLGMSESEAFALAELCKRISWHDCDNLASCPAEREAMLRATDKLGAALGKAGFRVR